MYKPQNIKEIVPDKDWPIGEMRFVDSETDDGGMYLVFGKTDIWQDSLENVHSICFPRHAIVVCQERHRGCSS